MPDERFEPTSDFERELEQLGPLMARQEIALSEEPDPEFVRSLRVRLTGMPEERQPAPVRRSLLSRLKERLGRRWMLGGGLSLAGVAIGLALLVINSRGTGTPGTPTKQVAFGAPRPGRNDILRTYPLLGGLGAGGATPPPWVSEFGFPGGAPYAGHLRLTAPSLPSGLSAAPAYRLQSPTIMVSRVPIMLRRLGITSPVTRTTQLGARWVYAADRQGATQIHSVAVSLATGELIYHDTRYSARVLQPGQRPSAADIAAARAWLTSIGLPGDRMRLHVPLTALERNLPWVIELDWTGAVPSDVAAAQLSVSADGHVTEAHVYAPIQAQGEVPTQTYASAWSVVQRGKAPIGVENVMGLPPRAGRGVMQRASLLEVLTHARNGTLYLVPAYRFSGTVTVTGVPGSRTWYALVPAGAAR